MTDQDIDALEAKIPALAAEAFSAARERALAAGLSILETDGPAIYEVFPSGNRRFIKKIKPGIPATIGQKYTIA